MQKTKPSRRSAKKNHHSSDRRPWIFYPYNFIWTHEIISKSVFEDLWNFPFSIGKHSLGMPFCLYIFQSNFFTFRTCSVFRTELVPLLWITIRIRNSSEPTISKTIPSSFRTRTSHFQLRPTSFRIPYPLLNFHPYPYFFRTRTPGSEDGKSSDPSPSFGVWYILKNCHHDSYGFQNLMSSWGSSTKISKLQQVGEFSFFGSKSLLLKPTHWENGILGKTAGVH